MQCAGPAGFSVTVVAYNIAQQWKVQHFECYKIVLKKKKKTLERTLHWACNSEKKKVVHALFHHKSSLCPCTVILPQHKATPVTPPPPPSPHTPIHTAKYSTLDNSNNNKKRTMLLMHKIIIKLWYRGIGVLDSAAEPRANATWDCRNFTHRCFAVISDCTFFNITWCIITAVLFFFSCPGQWNKITTHHLSVYKLHCGRILKKVLPSRGHRPDVFGNPPIAHLWERIVH